MILSGVILHNVIASYSRCLSHVTYGLHKQWLPIVAYLISRCDWRSALSSISFEVTSVILFNTSTTMPTCYLYWITYLLLNCVILTYHGVTGAPIDVFDQLPSDTEYRGATINRDSLAADLNAMSEGMEEEGMEEEGMEARSIDPFIFGLIMNLVRDVEDEMHTENGSIKESLAMRKSGMGFAININIHVNV